MSRRSLRWGAIGVAAALLVGGSSTAVAEPVTPPPVPDRAPTTAVAPDSRATPHADDLPDPLEANRRDLRDRALQEVLSGRREPITKNGSRVLRLGTKKAPLTRSQRGRVGAGRPVTTRTVEQYVELERQRTDRVFVLLVDFGDKRLDRYPDIDTDPDIAGPTRFDGPAANTIPAPDRRTDNSTIWRPDFDRAHYSDLYFGAGNQSLKSYYQRQSSGRYSIDGEVTDWVRVPYNQARYGRSNGFPCAVNVCANSWYLVKDALAAWTEQQQAAGRSDAEIATTLASFDVYDRYDHDGDGDFNEPDGYLDHLQVVHAGGDQAAGDPEYGEDAIWSHRWRAFQNGEDGAGPETFPIGGTQVGTSGVWAADYTMQAENAGMAVFAHEYGHDLGLPDHYDTADTGDNAVNWWSLMGQSRVKAARDVGVGTRAADLSAWDKLSLGWLDYTVADAGEERSIELGPHEYNSAAPQALVVRLPPKQVLTALPQPAAGQRQWWSGTGNSYAGGLARILTLPAASSLQLDFRANYNIQDCGPDACDYGYVEVDTGAGWRPIPGSITAAAEGNGIDGASAGWVPARFDLSAYAGRTIALRFRYSTDAGTQGADPDRAAGLFVDDIAITADGTTLLTDGAEDGANGWTVLGFRNVGASVSATYNHYYLASYRANLNDDRYLKTGPYHFGWPETRPAKVEHFGYQFGLLVCYWDTSYTDNNTSQHPGHGLILPIDARPELLRTTSGTPWRGRVQTYDAPFSLRPSDSMVLHDGGQPMLIRGQRARPRFDDTANHWDAELPRVGVQTPRVGVTLEVTEQSTSNLTVELGVAAGSEVAGLPGR